MRERRGHWYLLTGLILGVAIGLAASIFIFPVNFIDTEPYALKTKDRDNYRVLIARAYLVEVDNGRAAARLALLRDVSQTDALVAQAQRELREKGKDARNSELAILAAALSQDAVMITPLPKLTPAVAVSTGESGEVTPTAVLPTRTSAATITPRATATAQPAEPETWALCRKNALLDFFVPGLGTEAERATAGC